MQMNYASLINVILTMSSTKVLFSFLRRNLTLCSPRRSIGSSRPRGFCADIVGLTHGGLTDEQIRFRKSRTRLYDVVSYDHYRVLQRLRKEGLVHIKGPSTWVDQFPAAGGAKQSPIDITRHSVHKDSHLRDNPLTYSYDPDKCKLIVNPGYCWKVEVDGGDCVLRGGPLNHTYQLEQFHFHWGSDDKHGSEHTLDGRSYAAEAHLVHWNRDLYSSFDEASKVEGGLAVLGAFMEVGHEHPELNKLTNLLNVIQHKGDQYDLAGGFDPDTLIPHDKSYYTYEGSLTTPPCYESVTWIVFKKPIQLSHEQLTKFRELRCFGKDEECPCDEFKGFIVDNYRPTLPLGERSLRYCKSHDNESDSD